MQQLLYEALNSPAGRLFYSMKQQRLLTTITLSGIVLYILVFFPVIVTITDKVRILHPKIFMDCHSQDTTNTTEQDVFRDKMFEPLLSIYKRKAAGELDLKKKSFRSGSVPSVLIWSRPFTKEFWTAQVSEIVAEQCPLPCRVTFESKEVKEVDAIVIELRGAKSPRVVNQSLRPRNPHQPWIMLSLESPPLSSTHHKSDVLLFNGFFNRTMTYRLDSDILVPAGFVVSKEDAKVLPSAWVVPPILRIDQKSQFKKLAVVFIPNNGDFMYSNRWSYIEKFRKHAPLDIYDKADLKCNQEMAEYQQNNPNENECLKRAGVSYHFIFAFENNLCKDYITEMVYDYLYFPIVPVVRGAANYSLYLPPHSYINADEYSPMELAEKLLSLQRNEEEYQKYFEWKKYYQPSTIGKRSFCHLCARLYDTDIYESKVVSDFDNWFVYKSKCMQPIYTEDLRKQYKKK